MRTYLLQSEGSSDSGSLWSALESERAHRPTHGEQKLSGGTEPVSNLTRDASSSESTHRYLAFFRQCGFEHIELP